MLGYQLLQVEARGFISIKTESDIKEPEKNFQDLSWAFGVDSSRFAEEVRLMVAVIMLEADLVILNDRSSEDFFLRRSTMEQYNTELSVDPYQKNITATFHECQLKKKPDPHEPWLSGYYCPSFWAQHSHFKEQWAWHWQQQNTIQVSWSPATLIT